MCRHAAGRAALGAIVGVAARAPLTMQPTTMGADAGSGVANDVAAEDFVGPYAASGFVIAPGGEAGLRPPAAWYFADEYIATPRAGLPLTRVTPALRAFDDVAQAAQRAETGWPALVWNGSTRMLRDARIAPDGASVTANGETMALALVPKLALNRSYFDASSAHWLSTRSLTLRGEIRDGAFVVRSAWPQDFAVTANAVATPLARGLAPQAALRAAMRATPDGGAREPFTATLLHARPGAPAQWAGKPALLVMVNGAQGDDDEAWGGHFAIGTGVIGAGGAIGDMLINNFYSLDIVSEKGILAAPTPLDRYLGDLNSGQGWYRPSLITVAVLADTHAIDRIQPAFNRVFEQFWRHQLVYQHAMMNCAGISVDTLRALGWPIPSRGAASYVKAWLGVPYALARYRSVSRARLAYEYLTEDGTRLFPAIAFEEISAGLLRLATTGDDAHASDGARPRDGALAQLLAQDIVAIELLRIPQWPSSRAFGSWPVASADEYFGKVPADPADAQIVPVPARAFPARLRDADLLPEPRRRSDLPLIFWAGVAALIVGCALRFAARWL